MIVRAAGRGRDPDHEVTDLVLRADTPEERKELARLARFYSGRLRSPALREALVRMALEEPGPAGERNPTPRP
jgi:hypothetical protein